MKELSFVKALLEEGVREGCFPSATAAIGIGGETLYACAAGNADVDTVYDMASVSKIFAATMLALMAVEEGRITLYDTLARFFGAPEDKAGITILQLMTHTGRFTPTFLLEKEAATSDDAAAAILRHPLEDIAAGTPLYSCMGYILLGKILEQVYGGRLCDLAASRVFAPLGMRATTYAPQGDNIAPTELDPATGVAWCGIVHDENARFLGGNSANAGIFSTAADCARFASMLALGGRGLLAPRTLAVATQNYTPGHDVHRGLGFHLAGTPLNFMGDLFPAQSFGHTGFTGTSIAVDPARGIFAVLLSNRVHPTRDNDRHLRFRRIFHNRVYAALDRLSG